MDIIELGAIGELVGGVAVVASLLFVGVQLRSSRKTAPTASQNAWVADYNSMLMSVRGDPEWMQVFRKAVIDFNSLPLNDQARVHVFLSAHMLNGLSVFTASQEGHFDRRLARGFLTFCAQITKSPGFEQWWRHNRSTLEEGSGFVAYLENLAASDALQPLQELFPWYNVEPQEGLGR